MTTQNTSDKHTPKRSWKRYFGGRRFSFTAQLVEPFKQIRFGLHVIAVCFFYLVLLSGALWWSVRELYAQVIGWFEIAKEAQADLFLNNDLKTAAYIIGGVLLAFIINIIFVVVNKTHRMYGPIVSMNRFIQDLESGNYTARLKTREKDEFQDLVGKLNRLAEVLNKRHGDHSTKQ